MAISRNSVASGTNDSSSFNVTIGGTGVVVFVTYDSAQTLTASTLAGVSGTIIGTGNVASEGFKVTSVVYIGSFSGSQAVTFTWSGGTPGNIRSRFAGYNDVASVDASNQLTDTSGTVSTTVTASNCWVVGGVFAPIAAGAGNPTTGTNNDGNILPAGSSNDFLRGCAGDSNGTVATGSQSVTTTTTGGYTYTKHIIALAPVTTAIKTVNGLTYGSVKTINGLAKASVKTINGLA